MRARNLLPLPGDQQSAWLAGDLVLKPLDTDLATMTWIEALSTRLDGRSDFRVAPPVRTRNGELVSGGWTAWRYEPGDPAGSRYWQYQRTWDDVLDVADRLNTALADQPRPDLLEHRTDRWAHADSAVWGLILTGRGGQMATYLNRVSRYRRPITSQSQLIHGDLTGNVLFADGLPPLVIDFSPYWRPPTFAVAIVVADVMTNHTGGTELAVRQRQRPDFDQYLIQAALFRLFSEPDDIALTDSPYARTLDSICQLIDAGMLTS